MRGAAETSGQPHERQPRYNARAALAAKIGFNHSLVRLDDARRPLGQLLAMVENEYSLAQPHDYLHIVLHQQHRLAAVAECPHGVEQLIEEGAIHAGGGLVEQDQLRIGHEHADELDQLLLTVGEGARILVRQPLELDEAEQLPGARAGRGIVVRRHHEEVLERRQLAEDADDLEGAANALVKNLVGLEPVDALPLESNLAPVTLLHGGDGGEEGVLARAMGADQAVDAPGLERQRHAVHGRDAAEALHHAVHEEDGLFHQIVRGRLYFCCSTPRMPRGMRRTTATMMAPNRSWWT